MKKVILRLEVTVTDGRMQGDIEVIPLEKSQTYMQAQLVAVSTLGNWSMELHEKIGEELRRRAANP